MRRRHPLPKIWLMTDERIGDLDTAIAGLPRGSGIVFRHYCLAPKARRALFDHVRRATRRRGHVLLLAGRPSVARQWGADGAHDGSAMRSRGIRTVAVHNPAELARAKRVHADLIFVSPVFATRSHADARALGFSRLGLLVAKHREQTIALGGMAEKRARGLRALKLYGWAGIDAFDVRT